MKLHRPTADQLTPTRRRALILVPGLALGLAAGGWLLDGTRPSAATTAAAPPRAEPRAAIAARPQGGFTQGQRPTQVSEVVLVTLKPFGFDPDEITRRAGRFILAYNNRAGKDQVTLRLDDGQGTRLQERRMTIADLTWNGEFDLPPGTYYLRADEEPGWVCKLTVTP